MDSATLRHHATIAITPLLPSMAVANQDILVLALAARKALLHSSGGCCFQIDSTPLTRRHQKDEN